jgi:uncharacterized protein (TIGR02453 family)
VASRFTGFPSEAMTFLRALKKNNHREWFQPRKGVYEAKVKAPMVEMIASLNQNLARFAPDYVTDPQKAVFRIYRDTRFSPDKTPYKTHVAARFPRRGLGKDGGAGLYFSVSPEEVEVAGGIYMPDRDQLRIVREFLAEHHARLRRVLAGKKLAASMGGLWDQQSARVPRGYRPDHPAADLLRYKHWALYKLLDPAIAVTPALFEEVLADFRAMIPFVELMNEPLLAAAKKPRIEELF